MFRPSKQNCACGSPMSQVAKQCLECRRKRISQVCANCSKQFETAPSKKRLACSAICASALRGRGSGATQKTKRVAIQCKQCGKSRMVAKSYAERKYCSVSCSAVGKSGENSHQWKGGVTSAHQSFFGGREWKQKCREIWRRDRGNCQRCNERCQRGEVHHIASWARHASLRLANGNLALLCYQCHKFVHSKRNTQSEFLHRPGD